MHDQNRTANGESDEVSSEHYIIGNKKDERRKVINLLLQKKPTMCSQYISQERQLVENRSERSNLH